MTACQCIYYRFVLRVISADKLIVTVILSGQLITYR